MKTSNILLIGAAGVAAYFLFLKPKDQPSGGSDPLGGIADNISKGLQSAIPGLGVALPIIGGVTSWGWDAMTQGPASKPPYIPILNPVYVGTQAAGIQGAAMAAGVQLTGIKTQVSMPSVQGGYIVATPTGAGVQLRSSASPSIAVAHTVNQTATKLSPTPQTAPSVLKSTGMLSSLLPASTRWR